MTNAVRRTVLLAAVSTLLAAEVNAQDAANAAPPAAEDDLTLYVWGKRERGIGELTSATEGVVSYGSFADRPLLRTGEIAEVIPGLAVTQHSGSGKANQYFLRGFNLDHGTDFSVALNGAPLNLRTNAHGQGYLDLNVMIPELVEDIRYRKGPYFAQTGDFSAAGSSEFSLFRRLPESFFTATSGRFGYARVLGAANLGQDSYVALDLTASNGPWTRSEDLRRANLVYHVNVADWSLTGIGYGARWNSTDQIPLRAVRDGSISRQGNIDPTDGGKTNRFVFTAQRDEHDGWKAAAYLQKYELRLYSNFTYFLDNPVDGDQFSQAENRWIVGGNLAKSWAAGDAWTVAVGGEGRYDRIGRIGLYRTKARALLSTDRQDKVDQGSVGAYAEARWAEGPWRASVGARVDAMRVQVGSSNVLNSGNESDAIASPKATLAFRASDTVELYADVGRGFHSNDARGAVARVAPVSGDPVDPVNLFVPALGGELGVRYERPGFSTSFAVWGLTLDSELVYSGDAGDTESSNSSRRFGGEFLMNWTPVRGVNIDLSAASTRARYDDAGSGEDRIPNALRYVVTGGVSVAFSAQSSAEVTVRRLGPASLIEDGSVTSGSSTLTNVLYRYNFRRASVFAEVLNVLDRGDNDITYFYTSRLRGEPAEGVDDIHFHPMEPRTLRVGVTASF